MPTPNPVVKIEEPPKPAAPEPPKEKLPEAFMAPKPTEVAPTERKPPATIIETNILPPQAVPKVEVKPAPVAASAPVTPAAAAAPTAKPKPPVALNFDIKALVKSAVQNIPTDLEEEKANGGPIKVPRRKPGARECMQISRRFGVRVIPRKYMNTLQDYCTRGKVEHLIRMRERLDEHSRFLESQLAGLEALVREKGESDVVVPVLPERQEAKPPPQTSPTPAPAPAPVSLPPPTTTPAAAVPAPVPTTPAVPAAPPPPPPPIRTSSSTSNQVLRFT
jgi:hypothetical protein